MLRATLNLLGFMMLENLHSSNSSSSGIIIPNAQVSDSASVDYFLLVFQDLFKVPGVTEISVNYPGMVFYEENSVWKSKKDPSVDFKWALNLATAVAAYNNDEVGPAKPFLSAVLPGGERIQIVHPPACTDGTLSITIRRPSFLTRTLADYKKSGYFEKIKPISSELSADDFVLKELLLQKKYMEFLEKAVYYGKTIVIAGPTGSGKTTFMKALTEELPKHFRIITIEDTHELFMDNHPNTVHLFYKKPGVDGRTVSSPTDCLISCLRMKPDRILLAELRGAETLDFIDVASSGHSGSITSLHAGSAKEAFFRMVTMASQNPRASTLGNETIKAMLYQCIDVIVHCNNDHSGMAGARHMSEIWFEPEKKFGI